MPTTRKRLKVVTLNEDDIKNLREMAVAVATMQEALKTIKTMTEESHRTLRGHNGTKGLMERISTIELISLENQRTLNGSEMKDGLVTKIEHIEDTVNETSSTLENVNNLTTRVNEICETLKDIMRYPSLTWLVHYRFKGMAIVTAGMVTLIAIVAFPGTGVAQQLQFIIERLFIKWISL